MNIPAIIDASAKVHGVSPAELLGPCRARRYQPARQAVVVLGVEHGYRKVDIAKHMQRHHTSVIALLDSAEITMTPDRRQQIDAVRVVALATELSKYTRKG